MGWDPTQSGGKTADEIADLVHATQEHLIKRGALTNLMSDITDFVGFSQLLKRKQVAFKGGLDWRFDIIVDHNHSARHTKLYDTDQSNEVEALAKGIISPRFTTANYTYDEREPELQSADKEVIVRYVLKKNMQMRQSLAELIEADIWGSPEYADDKVTPYGFKFWFTRQSNSDAASHPNGGFDGKDPMLKTSSSDSTLKAVARAGLSSSTYARFANWAAQYADYGKADLIFKMRQAFRKTNFRSPITAVPEPTMATGRGIYSGDSVITALEDVLERQNMNLGNDIASKDGKVVFKGHPLTYVPVLDDDAAEPLYMIDWTSAGFGVLDGWIDKVSKPIIVPNMHNVRRVFLDSGWNMGCTNLRKNAVFSKAAA